MTDTKQHEQQINKLIKETAEIKEKISDKKIILNHFKITSQKLIELKRAKRGINEQIKEEKDRIESEHYENKDYEEAKNETLTLKKKLFEKVTQLKLAYRNKFRPPALQSEDLHVNGERLSVICEFSTKLYINGKELK